MDFLEKNLEDIIYDNALTKEGRKKLTDRGLEIYGEIFRQVELGGYGRIDLLSVCIETYTDWANEITKYHPHFYVYELKKKVINMEALLQGMRYVEGIKHLYEEAINDNRFDSKVQCKLILIGADFDKNSDFAFLYNNLDNVDIYTYKYGIDGMTFESIGQDWRRVTPQFCEDTMNTLTCPGYGLLSRLIRDDYE